MQSEQGKFSDYTTIKVLGKGTFGMVFLVKNPSGNQFAIKHVHQDKRYKNRQLQITAKLNHPNIIKLQNKFYETIGGKQYLNLVLEYMPETLSQKIKMCKIQGKKIPNDHIKAYALQLFSGLSYLTKVNVCHRDIKPSNILIGANRQLKICDFGSAKCLVQGQKNISYICSRYYRAPQLIFGSVNYSTQVDVWSVGCVIAEMVINRPIFQGENSTDQLAKIIRIIGTPTNQDIQNMKAKELTLQLPFVQPITLKKYLQKFNPNVDGELVQMLNRIFVYDPNKRYTAQLALKDGYFIDSAKDQSTQ